MSIKKTSSDGEFLILQFDNGDKIKFQQLMQDWNFKDEQSILRFAMSAMLETKDKTLTITTDSGDEKIRPVDEFLKK